MTLEIKLGIKREKRLMKHLKIEHPSVRGKIRVVKCTRKQINRITSEVPNFKRQARKFTKTRLQGGRK